TNAKGETYYLHQGTTKTGKPKYYFSMESNGELAPKFCAKFWGSKTHQIALSGMPALALREDETPSGATSRAVPLQSCEFISLYGIWYDVPLTSRYRDRRYHPWLVERFVNSYEVMVAYVGIAF